MRRIGVDVGGTFTDVVLFDDVADRVWSAKVPTTPADPAEGALNGIRRVLEISASAPADVGFVGHGTTIATNMIIEGEGAKTGLITTKGFRDILEIRRAWRHDRADLYDLFFTNPAPLVPRYMRLEVSERVLFDGKVETVLDTGDVDACIEALRGEGVQAVAVCLINSHLNDAHERQILDRVRAGLGGAFVTGSVEVNPEIMEYERTCTTVVNAVLGPRCGQYARKFAANARAAGLTADIYFMQSNGGLARPEATADRPVTLLESGPAGGVTAASRLCERLAIPNAITGDMGGTSFDVSLIRGFHPELRNDTMIRTFTVRCPNIDIVSIGAGGGSIAWIDAGGGVRIGPESARADPGPACYGRGGTRPTVTDCNLVLGHVDPEGFLSGDFALDRAAAVRAIETHLAGPLGVSVEEAALVVRRVANALMAQAIRLVTVERGYDPRDFVYVCYGGAGPVHAAELARELEIPTVVLPPMPGLFSAFGMLVADMVHDLQASIVQIVDEIDPADLQSRFEALEARARELMVEAGIPVDRTEIQRRADCCYLGQGETIQVSVPPGPVGRASLDAMVGEFVESHRRQWNFDQPDRPIRLVNIRVRVIGKIGEFGVGARGTRKGPLEPVGKTRIRLGSGWREVPRYRRDHLVEGDRLQGPLVIEELSSRLAIEDSDVAEVRPDGTVVVAIGEGLSVDTIAYEVIRNGLYAIAREMKIAMMRTAGSPIIHSGGDASAAIFDADMQLVAQGNDIPTMMGSAVISTRASVEAVGVHRLRPGDVIVSNDVYLGGGNHQPDVQFTRPVFLGGEIIAYTMTRGHWVDIGGTAPGSFTPVTWDIHAEGIRIPPVILFRGDRPDEDLLRMIVDNTRDPDNRMLDIKAQYAGTFVGGNRIIELARKHGRDTLRDAMARALDYSERLMRAEIEKIPDGVYCGEDLIEPVAAPGWPTDLVPVKVKITVAGDRMVFDYTGTAKQVRGGINCPLSVTCNSTWFTVKAITDPAIPINQGCYRPIEIICPEGTLLNCTYPASVVSGNTETSPRIIDMLLTTLAQAVPKRVVAQSYDAACSGIFSGLDPVESRVRAMRRKYVSQIDVHVGGFGARPADDGINAIRVLVGNTGSQSIEQIEHYAPLTLEKWEIVADTGGAGRWRGGLATERVYRIEYDEANITVIAERGRVSPKGILGGDEGTVFRSSIVRTDGTLEDVPSKGAYLLAARGDRVSIQPAGSGGYGDPLEREPERVLDDVRNGYVSPAAAQEKYGVVLDRAGTAVDAAATADLRRRLRAERVPVETAA